MVMHTFAHAPSNIDRDTHTHLNMHTTSYFIYPCDPLEKGIGRRQAMRILMQKAIEGGWSGYRVTAPDLPLPVSFAPVPWPHLP